jgi:hypothetical protein
MAADPTRTYHEQLDTTTHHDQWPVPDGGAMTDPTPVMATARPMWSCPGRWA